MKKQIQQLHDEMLTDIERCRQLSLAETERAECGYRVSVNYWERLKKYCCQENIIGEIGEVEFFKNVKPKFTSYIEFFTILYEAVLSVSSQVGKEKWFWEEEMKRYDRFRAKHDEFVSYYESGATKFDCIYFKRMINGFGYQHPKMTYDNDQKFCSKNDHLVRSLLAHKMYYQEVRRRLEIIEIENKF